MICPLDCFILNKVSAFHAPNPGPSRDLSFLKVAEGSVSCGEAPFPCATSRAAVRDDFSEFANRTKKRGSVC